jgi:hypothetical protein
MQPGMSETGGLSAKSTPSVLREIYGQKAAALGDTSGKRSKQASNPIKAPMLTRSIAEVVQNQGAPLPHANQPPCA